MLLKFNYRQQFAQYCVIPSPVLFNLHHNTDGLRYALCESSVCSQRGKKKLCFHSRQNTKQLKLPQHNQSLVSLDNTETCYLFARGSMSFRGIVIASKRFIMMCVINSLIAIKSIFISDQHTFISDTGLFCFFYISSIIVLRLIITNTFLFSYFITLCSLWQTIKPWSRKDNKCSKHPLRMSWH